METAHESKAPFLFRKLCGLTGRKKVFPRERGAKKRRGQAGAGEGRWGRGSWQGSARVAPSRTRENSLGEGAWRGLGRETGLQVQRGLWGHVLMGRGHPDIGPPPWLPASCSLSPWAVALGAPEKQSGEQGLEVPGEPWTR